MLRYFRCGFLAMVALFPAGSLRAGDERVSTVGRPARVEQIVLPGSELEVKPLADRTPIVLRIVHVAPHGTAFRYDLEYYGLEAGTFDLKDYLQRQDRSSAADLPSIPVTIQSVLPPGQIKPNELATRNAPRLGGYRLALFLGGVLWVLVLIAILFVGRQRRTARVLAVKPLTLADHLRPLVEGALAGQLSPARLAELERTLIIYWEQRLHMHDRRPGDALAELRHHPEAGPLLQQMETWLHRPGSGGSVDVAALLAPYQHVAADTLEEAVR
jgi:hypothetical protein